MRNPMVHTTLAAALLATLALGCSNLIDPGAAAPETAARATLVAGTGVPSPITSRLAPSQCVDVAGASRASGTQVQLWTCYGNDAQTFRWMSDGTIRVYEGSETMCLDAYGGAGNDGDAIIIWPCGGYSNQQWTATAGEIRGVKGKCLDVVNANPTTGARLVLWNCYGSPSQKWDNSGGPAITPPPPPPTATAITSRLAPSQCVDVAGANRASGTQVQLWTCYGNDAQTFRWMSDGTIHVYEGSETMCLDAYGGAGNDGDAIIIWPCGGYSNQQWTATAAGEIRGVKGKCLDVVNANPTTGARLVLWNCYGSPSQKWDFKGGSVAPPPPPPAVLLAAGDIAGCTSNGDEATAAMLDGLAGTVAILGDNAYDNGSIGDYTNCYGPSWGRHKARTRPAPGNHEYQTADAAGYFQYFGSAAGEPGKGYYSYDLGTWHIVVLNNMLEDPSASSQVAWLRQDLATHPAACTLAYWHYPRFSSGSHGNIPEMQTFWQVLYDAGADVVLNAHDHVYERFAPQTPTGAANGASGIREFIVGTGGKSLTSFVSVQPNSEVRYNANFGVLKLELGAGSYRWTFLSANGSTPDAGQGACH